MKRILLIIISATVVAAAILIPLGQAPAPADDFLQPDVSGLTSEPVSTEHSVADEAAYEEFDSIVTADLDERESSAPARGGPVEDGSVDNDSQSGQPASSASSEGSTSTTVSASSASKPPVSGDSSQVIGSAAASSAASSSRPQSSSPVTSKPSSTSSAVSSWPSFEFFPPESSSPQSSAPASSRPQSSQPQASSPESAPSAGDSSFAQQVVDLVNEERAKAGLAPLTVHTGATAAAQVRARETEQSFSHTRPNGSSFSTALTEQGVSYRSAGENIAWGQRTPQQVMEGWMNSSGHRANILNERFTSIGVGYYQSASGVNYWTQLFIG